MKQNRSITCAQSGVDIHSTILQTASLMKESVFLSPTFTPDVANMPGELEIACADNYQKFTSNCNVDGNAMNIEHNITGADLTVENPHHKSNKEIHSTKNNRKKSKHDKTMYENGMLVDNSKQDLDSTILEPVAPPKAQNTENVVIDMLEMTDGAAPTNDHPDEAYSSDSNNSNPEYALITHPEILPEQANKQINEISIISEQILSTSQFKELKYLHNHNSDTSTLLPISLNSLITKNTRVDDESNQNTIGYFTTNANKPQQNLVYIDKETDSRVQNNFQNSETILLYDDKGVIISPENCNGNVSADFPVHIVSNESLTLEEKYTVAEEIIGKVDNPEELNADSTFDVCIDFNVSDIEKHLEENEEILENFVNEITGSDSHAIIENLEVSEKTCSEKPHDIIKITDTACLEFESNSITDICLLKSYQNQSENKLEIIVDKFVSPNDHSSKNHSSATSDDPSKGIGMKTILGSKFVNQNSAKDNTVLNLNDALQHDTDSISMECEDKPSMHCSTFQNSKKKAIDDGTCAMSVSDYIETNKNVTRELNTDDKSVYYEHIKTRESEASPNTKKENNLIVYERYVKVIKTPSKYKSTSDKVEKIAIRQFNRGSGSVKPLCKSIDHKGLQTKCHKTYKPRFKMHIQGMEKPSGSESSDDNVNTNKLNIKTYGRTNKQKQTLAFTTNRLVMQDEINNDLSSIDERKYAQETNSVDFCLCKDFGSFTCYNDEGLYEHIHFLDHKKVNCDSQCLFSIYNEDKIANKEEIVDKEIKQDSSPTSVFSICWNNLVHKNVTEVNPDAIYKSCDEVNSVGDDYIIDHVHDKNVERKQEDSNNVSANIILNTEFGQNFTNKMVSRSSERLDHHSSIKIDASVRSESEFTDRFPILSCESGNNINVQMMQTEGIVVSDQIEDLSQITIMVWNSVGTAAHNTPTPKSNKLFHLPKNVEINLASCSKGETEDSSLRPVKVRISPKRQMIVIFRQRGSKCLSFVAAILTNGTKN